MTTTTVTSAAPRESGAGVQVDDWATRTAVAYVSDLRPAPHDFDGAVARLATVLREVACDCPMASPIVRPELADDEERDR